MRRSSASRLVQSHFRRSAACRCARLAALVVAAALRVAVGPTRSSAAAPCSGAPPPLGDKADETLSRFSAWCGAAWRWRRWGRPAALRRCWDEARVSRGMIAGFSLTLIAPVVRGGHSLRIAAHFGGPPALARWLRRHKLQTLDNPDRTASPAEGHRAGGRGSQPSAGGHFAGASSAQQDPAESQPTRI